MTIRVYELATRPQIDLLAAELRATLAEMADEFERSADEAWTDLLDYPNQYPYAAIWVALREGKLLAWSGAKIYIDLPRTVTAAVTMAWAAPGAGEAPGMLHRVMQAWARTHNARALYAARRSRLPAYSRWVARYGYVFDRVVFVHRLSDAGASASEGAAHELVGTAAGAHDALPASSGNGTPGPSVRREGVAVPVPAGGHEPRGDPGPEADVRSDAPGADRANGGAAGHGDLGTAAASRLQPAKRKVRRPDRHGSTTRRRRKHGRKHVRPGVVPP